MSIWAVTDRKTPSYVVVGIWEQEVTLSEKRVETRFWQNSPKPLKILTEVLGSIRLGRIRAKGGGEITIPSILLLWAHVLDLRY